MRAQLGPFFGCVFLRMGVQCNTPQITVLRARQVRNTAGLRPRSPFTLLVHSRMCAARWPSPVLHL